MIGNISNQTYSNYDNNYNNDSNLQVLAKKSSPNECETCSNRTYQDGSNEMVSFKSGGHISPENSASMVRSHEQEHVANAYKKEAQGNAEVISATVTLQTSLCPECGRSYVSGGNTQTQIKYTNESNPYQQELKAQHATQLSGLFYNQTA